MRKLVGNSILTVLTVVFCVFLTEIGIRVIDGLPVVTLTLPPLGGAIGTDTTATHLKNIPLANGVDRAWFATEPPPLPNRTPPPAEWVELDKKLLRTPTFGGGRVPFKSWDMFKAWNSAFVGDVCKHTYLSGAPGRLYVYDPPDGQPRPFFRFLPNASAPDGLVTNAFGWRGPPVQFQRAPKTVRIVFVGASTVAEIHSYPFSVPEYVNDWLNRWAQARKLDLKFEILNAGRESINSTDIAGVVRQEVAPARPDLVVYYEGNNQLQLSTVVKNVPAGGTPLPAGEFAQTLRRWSQHSAIARRAEGFTSGAEWPKPDYKVEWPQGLDEQNPDIARADLPVNLNIIMRDLDSIRADLAKVDSELALSTFHWLVKDGLIINAMTQKPVLENLNVGYFPFRYRDLERLTAFENRVFAKYAAAHGMPLVDVARYMPYDPELFTDATHNTPPGVKLRAWIVLQQLVPLIEKKLASGAWPKPVTAMGDTHPAFTVPPRIIPVDCKDS